jgi:hypothetical protein
MRSAANRRAAWRGGSMALAKNCAAAHIGSVLAAASAWHRGGAKKHRRVSWHQRHHGGARKAAGKQRIKRRGGKQHGGISGKRKRNGIVSGAKILAWRHHSINMAA